MTTTLTAERFAELQGKEEFVLTVASSGFGKRTSAYEYRVTGRGGKGVELMNLGKGGEVVANIFASVKPLSAAAIAGALAVADRIVLLREGVIQLQGPRDEVLAAMRPDRHRGSPGDAPGGSSAQPPMALA